MPTCYLVTTKSAEGAKTSNARYTTIEGALDRASLLLGNGEHSVWIIDGAGNLVLPPDQVRLRLNLPSGSARRAI